jgi:hypothetical protein
MVGYFDDLAAATRGGEVDDVSLSEIAAKYHMKVLEEAPENYV